MAVKIISRGILPEEKIYKTTCKKCSTIFQFEHQDALPFYDQRDGNFLIINCPVCKGRCSVAL